MEIPNCYDPVYQEERRQAEADRRAECFPTCGCCGHKIYPHEKFWVLLVIKDELIVCEDCRTEMEDSVCIVEDVRYGRYE